jgi:arsenate reductase
MIQIYHNPRCGKSRNCLALLDDASEEYQIIKYLDNPPTYEDLVVLLKKLQFKPIALVRQKEKIWIENYKNKSLSDEEIIKTMVLYPILIERPVVIKGDKAMIARDLDKATAFLK